MCGIPGSAGVLWTEEEEWTRDAPKKTGFYWIWLPGLDLQGPSIATVDIEGGVPVARMAGAPGAILVYDGLAQWMGPIEEPYPPVE